MARHEVPPRHAAREGIKEDTITCIVFDLHASEPAVSCLRKSPGTVVKAGMGEHWLRGPALAEGRFGACLITFTKLRLIFEAKCQWGLCT
jgi:hypothetical protein